MNRKKVAVGLSGGVDSAVSAWLLKEQGYEVVGIHLYCWPPKSEYEKEGVSRDEWIKKNGCRADEDRQSALKTALEVGIPFKVLDFSEEYSRLVIDNFYEEYKNGRTPNPDILCNSEIKFGLFLDWALENGFDYIATGHYAKKVISDKFSRGSGCNKIRARMSWSLPGVSARGFVITPAPLSHLMVPKDRHKDQTYFLWKLGQRELSHILFPLGGYLKSEVREVAKKEKLSVADKKDSQGICFVGNVEAREFLAKRLVKKEGIVFDPKGNKVGTHDGVWFYTIGQRGGWKMEPKFQKIMMASGETPVYYVISKKAEDNSLVVGTSDEAVAGVFEVGQVNSILGRGIKGKVGVRIRHGGEIINCQVSPNDGGLMVNLEKEVRGIASGQSAVFYEGGVCLGGGVIE